MEPSESTAEVVIRLGAGRVEGRLLRLDGKPVRARVALWKTVRRVSGGMAVTARQGAVETDGEGRFRFERVSEGLHGLELMSEGLHLFERDMDVQPDAGGVERRVLTTREEAALTLVAEVTVEGPGPAAQDRLRVWAERKAGEGNVGLIWDHLGHVFRAMGPVAPGVWTIRATAQGYEAAETALTVRLDPPTERARLVLRPSR